jgi:hypothetical protein
MERFLIGKDSLAENSAFSGSFRLDSMRRKKDESITREKTDHCFSDFGE